MILREKTPPRTAWGTLVTGRLKRPQLVKITWDYPYAPDQGPKKSFTLYQKCDI